MADYTPNPGAAPQPGNNDPNATRYFQPSEGAMPSSPTHPETPRQAAYPDSPATTGSTPQQPGTGMPYPPYPSPPGYGAQPQAAQGQQGYYPHQMPAYQQPQPNVSPADKHDRDRTTLGLILIGGGVLFLLSQFSALSSFGDLVLLLIGGGFLYSYFSTRAGYRIGFLIPGAILTGIGVGQVLEKFAFFRLGDDITALTLGLGFCAIWFFERRHWWFLIPGGILVLSGLSSMYYIGRAWPLVLIGIGVYMLLGQSRRKV